MLRANSLAHFAAYRTALQSRAKKNKNLEDKETLKNRQIDLCPSCRTPLSFLAGIRFSVSAKLPPLAARLPPADLECCWADVARADAAKAYQAMWKLAGDPAAAVPLLAGKLRPVPAPDPQKLVRLVAELDAADAEVRERATAELEKLAELADPALRQVLAGKPSLEVRQRVERLLERLDERLGQATYLPILRGLEVLERIGTPESRQLFEKMAAGAGGSIVTREARAALGR